MKLCDCVWLMVWMEAMVHLSLARGQTAGIHPHNTTSHWTLEKYFNNPLSWVMWTPITFPQTMRHGKLKKTIGKKENTDHGRTINVNISPQILNMIPTLVKISCQCAFIVPRYILHDTKESEILALWIVFDAKMQRVCMHVYLRHYRLIRIHKRLWVQRRERVCALLRPLGPFDFTAIFW